MCCNLPNSNLFISYYYYTLLEKEYVETHIFKGLAKGRWI